MSSSTREIRVLVVDADDRIRCALHSLLVSQKYRVDLAESRERAVDLAVDHTPDVVLLDPTHADTGGVELCRELREWLSAPILILSANANPDEKIAALDAGADDYLTKPFVAGELLARIRALLRRVESALPADFVVHAGDLEIDLARRRVRRCGAEVKLTRTEFDILALLARHPRHVTTVKRILERVWGTCYDEDVHTLRVHIGNLRKKIERDPSTPHFILTEPGVGYLFSGS